MSETREITLGQLRELIKRGQASDLHGERDNTLHLWYALQGKPERRVMDIMSDLLSEALALAWEGLHCEVEHDQVEELSQRVEDGIDKAMKIVRGEV